MSIWISCGGCAVGCSVAGENLVEPLVSLVDADVHAAGEKGVAALERVDQRGGGEPGATGSEVLQDELRQGDSLGEALEGEALKAQLAGPHLVEAPVDSVLLAVMGVHVAVGASRAA